MKKLDIELELPNHDIDLERAKNILDKAERDIVWFKTKQIDIPDRKKQVLTHTIDVVLNGVGLMSQSRFDVRDKLEEEYSKAFIKQPALGKELYLKHYESLHKPFDKLKNKCFNLFYKLDNINEDFD